MAEKRGPPSNITDEDGDDMGSAIILKRQKVAQDAVILGSITKEVGLALCEIQAVPVPHSNCQ